MRPVLVVSSLTMLAKVKSSSQVLGGEIRATRAEHGLTQLELAEEGRVASHLPEPRGNRATQPTLALLNQFAQALRIELYELIARAEQ